MENNIRKPLFLLLKGLKRFQEVFLNLSHSELHSQVGGSSHSLSQQKLVK